MSDSRFLELDEKEAIRKRLPSWAQDFLDFSSLYNWPHARIAGLTWWEVDIENRRFNLKSGLSFEDGAAGIVEAAVPVLERRREAMNGHHVFHDDGKPITTETWQAALAQVLPKRQPRTEVPDQGEAPQISQKNESHPLHQLGVKIREGEPHPLDTPIVESADGGVTVLQVLQNYLAQYRLRGGRSLVSMRYDLRKLVARFGSLDTNALTTRMLKQYQVDRRMEGFANGTINRELAVLKAAYNVALDDELIQAAPRFPKRLRPGAPRQGFFTTEMYRAVYEQLPSWAKGVLEFGWLTGWRRGEVFHLRWEEVDLHEGHIRLNPNRSKNEHSRILPLSEPLRKVLEHQQEQREESLPFVFHKNGRRINFTEWYRMWHPAVKKAGYPGLYFHDLRRSAARDLVLAGVDEKTAMSITGHRSRHVFDHYHIVKVDDAKDALDRMATRRNGSAPAQAPPAENPKPKRRQADVEGRLAEIVAELGIKKR